MRTACPAQRLYHPDAVSAPLGRAFSSHARPSAANNGTPATSMGNVNVHSLFFEWQGLPECNDIQEQPSVANTDASYSLAPQTILFGGIT